MRYKCAIFDLDGTLLNTLEDLADAVNVALSHADCPTRTLEEVRNFVGNGVELLMRRATPDDGGNRDFSAVLTDFKTHYSKHCEDKTKPYEGVLEGLEKLQDGNVKCAIVSNKFDGAVKKLAQKYFGQCIQVAVGESERIHKKPEPDMVFEVVKELHVDCSECVYIGDSDVDIQTAKNSGMDVISVDWGFRDSQFLKEHGAKNIVHSMDELVDCIMQ